MVKLLLVAASRELSLKIYTEKQIHCKVPKFWDTKNFAVIYLKFKQSGQTPRYFRQKDADGTANSADPDQQSDLGLHCLPRPICPKT